MNASLTINNVLNGTFNERACTFTFAGNGALLAGLQPNTICVLNIPANPEFQNTQVRILGVNGNVIQLQTV